MTMMERMQALEDRVRKLEAAALASTPFAGYPYVDRPCGYPPISDEARRAAPSEELPGQVSSASEPPATPERARGAAPIPPGVPDELHRELEDAVAALLSSADKGAELVNPIRVEAGILLRVAGARVLVRKARADIPAFPESRKEEPRADADGAISGTDSEAISTSDGASAGVAEAPREHEIHSDSNGAMCAKCGKRAVLRYVAQIGTRFVIDCLCHVPPPTGSGGGGS